MRYLMSYIVGSSLGIFILLKTPYPGLPWLYGINVDLVVVASAVIGGGFMVLALWGVQKLRLWR